MRSSSGTTGIGAAVQSGMPAALVVLAAGSLTGAAAAFAASAWVTGCVLVLLAAILCGASITAVLLLRSQRQMLAVLEQGIDAVAIVRIGRNGALELHYVNEKIVRLCGPISPAEGLLEHPAVQGGLRAAAAGGQATQQEIAWESGATPARWLHCQFLPVPRGAALMMRDVTEHKAEEREARENRAFMQSLIEYLPVLIFAKSFRAEDYDKMLVWNKTAEHVMGYSADQVLGKSNSEIFPGKVADTLNALDRQMLAAPKVMTIPEFPYRRPDGAMRYLRSISVPLFGPENKVDYILGIVEDITDRRAQEWELRGQRAELSAINDALPVGLFRTDAEGRVVYVNSTFLRMMKLEYEQVARDGWYGTVHPEERATVFEEWTRAIKSELPYENTLRFIVGGERVLWATLKAAQIRID
ncbi:MAG: PAS domain-containing protein, partial [Burkholderiaceae bacterium]|nr:PAS domain-containing protein [Burkholderiaceae bacterium]